MDPQIAAAIASAQRPGWVRTGVEPATSPQRVPDMEFGKPTGTYHTEQVPNGLERWTIASPDGQNTDTITVKPPEAPMPIGGTTAWPTDASGQPVAPAANYTVIQGPTKQLPTPTRSANPTPTDQNEAALNVERAQNATSSPYGRVTNAELYALKAKEAAAGRQLTNDEKNQTLANSREERLTNAQTQTAANQAATNSRLAQTQQDANSIAQQRLALDQQKRVDELAKPDVKVIGNQLVDAGTGQVRYTAPEGAKFQTAQDGTILLVDPQNPSQPAVVWSPSKPPALLPGQSPNQRQFVQTDPKTGALSGVDNPIYTPDAVQKFQSLQDGITAIQGMLTRGEIDIPTASKYKGALQQNFDAALQGTTPYQQFQDKQTAALNRAQTGASLLNQRVSSGSGLAQNLLQGALGIAGNKNFMDPSAVQGLSIFGGANSIGDFINNLGGGQGTLDAAQGAVQSGLQTPDYASALLQSALGGGAQQQPMQPGQPGPPAYGGENIGSGAASNPQPPMIPAGAGGPIQQDQQFMNDQRHMPPQQGGGYDPAAILLQAALTGGLQSY